MTEALTYIYMVYNGFIDLLFNKMMIFSGVSVGMVLIDITLITAVTNAFVRLPNMRVQEDKNE